MAAASPPPPPHGSAVTDGSEPPDPAGIRRRIAEEVAARRAAGQLTPELERELDLAFARHSPPEAAGSDLQALFARAEHATFIDVNAPVDSARPLVPELKRALRKAVAFNFRHVAQQTSTMGQALLRVARALEERISALEARDPLSTPALASVIGPALPVVELPGAVVERLAGVGRVLVAGLADPRTIGRLRELDVDAYGVWPGAPPGVADVRAEPVDAHLDRVAEGALGAVVLCGVTDWWPTAARVRLVETAARRVRPGGEVIVVAHRPELWDGLAPGTVRELAPGRPLSATTWVALLGALGLVDPEDLSDGRAVAVAAVVGG